MAVGIKVHRRPVDGTEMLDQKRGVPLGRIAGRRRRGSVAGCALVPVVKVCANPDPYARMSGDMDVNAGAVASGGLSLEAVAGEIYAKALRVASGEKSRSEALGHREFFLGYKRFDGCRPNS